MKNQYSPSPPPPCPQKALSEYPWVTMNNSRLWAQYPRPADLKKRLPEGPSGEGVFWGCRARSPWPSQAQDPISLFLLYCFPRSSPSQIDPFWDRGMTLIPGAAFNHFMKVQDEPRSPEGFELTEVGVTPFLKNLRLTGSSYFFLVVLCRCFREQPAKSYKAGWKQLFQPR